MKGGVLSTFFAKIFSGKVMIYTGGGM